MTSTGLAQESYETEIVVATNVSKTAVRSRGLDARKTPSSSEASAMRGASQGQRNEDTDAPTGGRRSDIMDIARWNSRQMSMDRRADPLGVGGQQIEMLQGESAMHLRGPSSSSDTSPVTAVHGTGHEGQVVNMGAIAEARDERGASSRRRQVLNASRGGSPSDDGQESVRTATEHSGGVSDSGSD